MNVISYSFEPNRAAGLARLSLFGPRMGRDYAEHRNTDKGPKTRDNVSMLSPYLRFRLITEEEVLQTVFERFTWATAEKFIQEVFWRAYFKGYLETHPSIWRTYLTDLEELENTRGDSRYQTAINGQTSIECFNHWVGELKSTGYLHNHARMWFASIWIFTLKLPWQLGADFMYRHLIDGDPASNTLSWRWVAGLHTKGKTYLARPDNIEKYSNGQFRPTGLALQASALQEQILHGAVPFPTSGSQWPEGQYGLLVTSEDLSCDALAPASIAITVEPVTKPSGMEGAVSYAFRKAILKEAMQHMARATPVHTLAKLKPEHVLQWCQLENITTVAVAYAPLGPESAALDAIEQHLAQYGITLLKVRRRYDSLTWPHASKGFFAMKEKIPLILEKLHLKSAQGELL